MATYKKRNLDPMFLRIERDGKEECVCLSDMTGIEIEKAIADKDVNWLRGAVALLAGCLRGLGERYDAEKEF